MDKQGCKECRFYAKSTKENEHICVNVHSVFYGENMRETEVCNKYFRRENDASVSDK
jgi:hypothetical protein